MPIGTPTNLGTANTKASTTETITTVASVASGDTIFVAVATNGAAATSLGVSDAFGNTYSLLSSAAYNNVSTNGVLYVYVSYQTGALPSGNTITATASNAVLCAASALVVASLAGANIVGAVVTATGSSTAPTASKTGLTAGTNYLALGFVGVQGTTADTFTQVSGWAAPPTRVSSTGGNVTTNAMIEGGYDAFTGVTSITYNPTITSRPWSEILVVYTTAVTLSSTVSETATVDADETNTAVLLASGSETATAADSSIATAPYFRTADEAVTPTDSATRTVTYTGADTETATVTHSQTNIATLLGAAIETAAQTAVAVTTGSTYNVLMTEAATQTAAALGAATYPVDRTEVVSLDDALSNYMTSVVDVQESILATELLDVGTGYPVLVTEIALALDIWLGFRVRAVSATKFSASSSTVLIKAVYATQQNPGTAGVTVTVGSAYAQVQELGAQLSGE